MNRNLVIGLCLSASMAVTLACDLSSPSRPTPNPVSGGGSTELKVSAPTPQSPANGSRLSDIVVSGITLTASAASPTYAPSASLQYQFELSGPGGGVIETSGMMGGPSWRQSRTLEYDTRYTWRVRAGQDGAFGPWSSVAAFLTAELPPEFRCRPPFMSEPIDIMLCHIDVLGGLEHDTLVPWLRRVARDFNIAGVPGGPFGILVKRTGNNCDGYSCDILCSGQGGNQLQFDVLINDTIPVWGGGGADVHDGIRVDICEIQ